MGSWKQTNRESAATAGLGLDTDLSGRGRIGREEEAADEVDTGLAEDLAVEVGLLAGVGVTQSLRVLGLGFVIDTTSAASSSDPSELDSMRVFVLPSFEGGRVL